MNSKASVPRTEVIETAAAWMAKLWSEQASQQDQQACRQWRNQDPEHERAWQALVAVAEPFNRLPEHANSKLLDKSAVGRRQLLTWASVVVAGSAGFYGAREANLLPMDVDYATGVGETRTVHLADGSQVVMNTNTQIDVLMDHYQRTIRLHQGEIMITTGHDGPFQNEVFSVVTEHGRVQALGTRFNVRDFDGISEVAVLEDAVLLHHGVESVRIVAGQQLQFDHASRGTIKPLQQSRTSWQEQKFVAEQLPVKTFINEIQRYKRGVIRCDEEAGKLRVTGVFPLNDPTQALKNLAEVLPIEVRSITPYWVTISAAR